ncbi:MAG: MFS transporter [Deltaproteobacteria bacterium]|nr:MFS transporter [Deltaproteobacteria bacterium]
MQPAASAKSETSKRHLAAAGVMLVIFLFAIDATIVSTAMPTIVAKLGGLDLYSWVFSIYMLTSALATPVCGKLADLFSKRRLMLAGIGVFLLGSLLCGVANSMEAMIAFRAVQGIGGGAIYALSFIVVGVLFPADQRAKFQGYISGIWGIASILGPLAGGLIVEYSNWRWIFFVNLPLVVIATALIIVGLKEARATRREAKLDLAGAGALLIGLLLIFYALTESAHRRHPLGSETVGLMLAGCAVLVAFYFVERRAAEPIIPLDLFHVRLYKGATAVSTLCAMGVFGAIGYLPLYLQGVRGMSASGTGLVVLALSMGWTIGSFSAGHSIDRIGYRLVAATGMSFLAVGYLVLITPQLNAGILAVVLGASLIGIGMGLANLTMLVAAQSTVAPQRIGVATSTVMLFRTFGAAFSVSLLGTVMLSQMHNSLTLLRSAHPNVAASVWDKLANPQNLLEPATRNLVPSDLLPRLVASLDDALWYAFLTGLILMIVGVAASLALSNNRSASAQRPKDSSGV